MMRASALAAAIERDLADAGIERPVKRKCEQCSGDIPNWRNGPSKTRFCSSKCQGRSKKLQTLAEPSTLLLTAETEKRDP
jgi:hypothetical protein